MKIKSLFATALVTFSALSASSAFAAADDVNQTLAMTYSSIDGSYTASPAATHAAAGAFSDVFTFTPSVGTSLIDTVLINIGTFASKNIDFTSAYIGTQALTIINGQLDYALTADPYVFTGGTLTLSVNGIVTGTSGSYGGSFNVLPVPEPETYAMMLAGLGFVGFMARRRKSAKVVAAVA